MRTLHHSFVDNALFIPQKPIPYWGRGRQDILREPPHPHPHPPQAAPESACRGVHPLALLPSDPEPEDRTQDNSERGAALRLQRPPCKGAVGPAPSGITFELVRNSGSISLRRAGAGRGSQPGPGLGRASGRRQHTPRGGVAAPAGRSSLKDRRARHARATGPGWGLSGVHGTEVASGHQANGAPAPSPRSGTVTP